MAADARAKKLDKTIFPALILVLQVVFILVFAFLGHYPDEAKPHYISTTAPTTETPAEDEEATTTTTEFPTTTLYAGTVEYYPVLMDLHVMIFLGFGLLWTFLKRYGYSAVGINLIIAVIAIQWGIIVRGLIAYQTHIPVGIKDLIYADFVAAAVLISFGALLGKVNPTQLLVLTLIEVPLVLVNEYIGIKLLKVSDIGRSMFVHVFGAYFGLAASRGLYQIYHSQDPREAPIYHSDLFSIIGTLFLWVFWPSFNSAWAVNDDEQHRAVVNTAFALFASVSITFAISVLTRKDRKITMAHVQNATLAGGVAVGALANLSIEPFGALLVGLFGGLVAIAGFASIQRILHDKAKFHDSRGIHNVHGLPGIIAAIGASIAAGCATFENYGYGLFDIYPARAPHNVTELVDHQNWEHLRRYVAHGENRTAEEQAGFQLAALAVTLVLAVVGGLITGILLKLPFWNGPDTGSVYDDAVFWEVAPELSSTHYTVVRDLSGGEKQVLEMTLHSTGDNL